MTAKCVIEIEQGKKGQGEPKLVWGGTLGRGKYAEPTGKLTRARLRTSYTGGSGTGRVGFYAVSRVPARSAGNPGPDGPPPSGEVRPSYKRTGLSVRTKKPGPLAYTPSNHQK